MAREGMLTASRFATVCELNDYEDAYALFFAMMKGELADVDFANGGVDGGVIKSIPLALDSASTNATEYNKEPNDHMQRGVDFERRALDDYTRAFGLQIEETGLFRHTNYSRLGASPDALLKNCDGLVEVKCPSREPSSRVPSMYMPQIQGWVSSRIYIHSDNAQHRSTNHLCKLCVKGNWKFAIGRFATLCRGILTKAFECSACLEAPNTGIGCCPSSSSLSSGL